MSPSDAKREFAVDVVRRLQGAGFRALWAGGCVRDLLLGRAAQDYDVATDARPDAVRALFGRRRTLAVGASFGVIIVVGSKEAGNVEVATFRTEGPYLDGRRPEHVDFSTPELDAQRRDFTINGMFYDPVAERVHDYVGGEADLSAGVVRAIGDPFDRMREDKLRMMRAVRFAATMEFELDPATADAVRAMAAEVHAVSAERIAQELRKMLVNAHRKRAMELARQVGVLNQILPELVPILGRTAEESPHAAWDRTLHRLHLLNQPRFELAAAALLCAISDTRAAVPAAPSPAEASHAGRVVQIAHDVCKRLRLSNQETSDVSWLLANLGDVANSRAFSLAQTKKLLAHPNARDLVALARADTLARGGDLSPVMHCEEFLQNTPAALLNPPPLVTGDDLIALGLEPGKEFRGILDAVRDAQLNGQIAATDEALQLVRRLQADGRHDN